ncbi:coenzyme F420 hydrogenase domain protein [Enterococcus faecalis 13-SD-W-01]|nr:coenzyme F420 hydrogenase domain protein [Enterococcus faecalis 13-SD-W-01]
MFTSEEGAYPIINEAVDKYENHFSKEFPLYEYLHITKDEKYDFSLAGANKLAQFIEDCINDKKPVLIPEGYDDRLY